jgi:hypothetical protein
MHPEKAFGTEGAADQRRNYPDAALVQTQVSSDSLPLSGDPARTVMDRELFAFPGGNSG